MKLKAILVLTLLTSSCSQLKTANSNAFPTPTDFELAEKKLNQTEVDKDYIGKLSLDEIKKENRNLKETIVKLAKSSNLSILETTEMPNDDLEARVWRHNGWSKMWLFVLKRSNGKWSADFQEQTLDEETGKVIKTSKRKIGKPKSDWESVWKKLTNEELLTLPSGFENNGWLPCPDCGDVTIETKVNGNYRFYAYTEPYLGSDIRETKQVAKIINIIAEDFNIKEFKADNL